MNRPISYVYVNGKMGSNAFAFDGLNAGGGSAGPYRIDVITSYSIHYTKLYDPAKSDFTQLIQVSLAYRKIDWEHTVAGTSGSDDWRAPIEA